MNVVNRLRFVADAYAEKPAVISDEGELTYDELYELVDRYAAALERHGVSEGNRFNLLMPNSNRMLATLLAGWQLGAVPAPINLRLGAETIEFLIEDSGSEYVVDDRLRDDLDADALGEPEVLWSDSGSAVLGLELGADERRTAVTPALDDSVALFLHTAGTTGRPKWVRLTHGNVSASAGTMLGYGLSAADTGIHYFPLYHSGGIDLSLCRLLIGATLVLGSGWDPEDALQKIERYGADGITVVPQMGYELVHHEAVDDYDLSSLDYFLVGSDTVSEELASEFRALGAYPMQGYGLTETMAVIATNPLGDPDCPLDSTGRVIEDIVNAWIVDPDTGEELPDGEVGEIVVSGDKVAPGYHNRPEREAQVFEDGAIHTEDLGYFDEDDYLHITGRLDDMLIVGGENVYPTEIEETLEHHEAVAQVVVVPAPDERKGQIPVANVVLEEGASVTEQELKDWFIERSAAFKHPRRIRFVDSVPTTALGKIDRSELESVVRDELSASD